MRSLRNNPCTDFKNSLLELIRDVAKMQMGHGLDHDSEFMERAREKAEGRFRKAQEKLREVTDELERLKAEQISKNIESPQEAKGPENALEGNEITAEMQSLEDERDELRKEPQSVTKKDYDETLRDLEIKGLVERGPHMVRITSRGARVMGQGLLARILLNLERRGLGPHKIEDAGAGAWAGSTVRPYEPGDPYHRINIERTLLSALERGVPMSGFDAGDFRVWEPLHSTELQIGVLVDQSASMRKKGKLEAAVETALALSELMRTLYPEDRLKMIVFSEEVREVEPWMLTAATVPMKFTDIRAALKAFRNRVIYESGNKQCYIVTDTAPNYLESEFVGFTKAMAAVIDEASLYRIHGIVLNIIMLDDDPQLREMAQRVAQENLGRVAYVDPDNLGEVVVEDYLSLKLSPTV